MVLKQVVIKRINIHKPELFFVLFGYTCDTTDYVWGKFLRGAKHVSIVI